MHLPKALKSGILSLWYLAHQNDRLNYNFVNENNVVGKIMTRNGRKMRLSIVNIRLDESDFKKVSERNIL